MSGAGIGGTLGSVLGMALAPETGGLSLAIPAIAGAAGSALGGSLTGSHNIGMDALLGGIGGGLGAWGGLGDSLGINDSAGLWGDAAETGAAGAGAGVADGAGFDAANAALQSGGSSAALNGIDPATGGLNAASILGNTAPAAAGAGNSAASGILGYLGKQNPLNLALAGGSVLSGIDSLLPKKQVNIGQNAANVMATNPNFNAALPQYSLNNTGTPYAGDWYKYGEIPQTPMYNGQLTQMAKGGMVKGYADGGPIAPPVLMASQPPMAPVAPGGASSGVPNPLLLKGLHTVGLAIGEHLKKHSPLFTGHGQVHGKGGGQADAVPAKLSQGEFVIPSEVVSQLGDGASDAGADALHKMVANVRKHKTSKGPGFPPKARNPLTYIKKA